jgi:hypothetical protein
LHVSEGSAGTHERYVRDGETPCFIATQVHWPLGSTAGWAFMMQKRTLAFVHNDIDLGGCR